jgi:hypothetical protein
MGDHGKFLLFFVTRDVSGQISEFFRQEQFYETGGGLQGRDHDVLVLSVAIRETGILDQDQFAARGAEPPGWQAVGQCATHRPYQGVVFRILASGPGKPVAGGEAGGGENPVGQARAPEYRGQIHGGSYN